MVAQVLFLALMESRFSHLPQLGRLWVAAASWLSPEKRGSDRPFARIEKMCLFLILLEGLSAFELRRMVSLIFGGTALATGPDAEGRGRNGGREGAKGGM